MFTSEDWYLKGLLENTVSPSTSHTPLPPTTHTHTHTHSYYAHTSQETETCFYLGFQNTALRLKSGNMLLLLIFSTIGNECKYTPVAVVQPLSRVWLFVTPRTVAHQAPLSMGFPRQEYWSRLLSFSSRSSPPRDRTCIFCIAGRFFTPELPRKPQISTYPPILFSETDCEQVKEVENSLNRVLGS